MNEKVNELVERTRLNGEDWELINQKCGFDVVDIIINLDKQYSVNEQMEMIVERCDEVAKAQDAKTLKDVGEWLEKRIIGGSEGYLMLKSWDKKVFEKGELPE